MRLPDNDANDHAELQQYATALRAGREKFVNCLNSGMYDVKGMNDFLKSVFELMKRSTGRSYSVPVRPLCISNSICTRVKIAVSALVKLRLC